MKKNNFWHRILCEKEGKTVPMYYPRNYNFVNRDGVLFKENLLWEQKIRFALIISDLLSAAWR